MCTDEAVVGLMMARGESSRWNGESEDGVRSVWARSRDRIGSDAGSGEATVLEWWWLWKSGVVLACSQ